MKRARAFWFGMGLLLVGVWLLDASSAAAQAAASTGVPRTLRDGKPTQRFAGRARVRDAKPAKRATPAPGIALDRSTLLGRAALEQRSMALLQREIAVLQRLLINSPRQHARRPDVLLRLAHAYQELMFQQKLRIHQLREANGNECRCERTDDANAGPSAVACSAPPATAELLSAR